jgi:REP element-mobilizing transposase RayT
MPRQLRIEYENAVYHVLARGNRGGLIFQDGRDRETFLRTLGETCERTGFRLHAWVLMGNHYHAVIRTPNANLVEGMRWLQNTYTRRFNVRHQQWGRLFGDRYKSVLVESGLSGAPSSDGDYLKSLIDYVHLNPARAQIIQASKGESIRDYQWSSIFHGYAQPPGKRTQWIDVEGVLAVYGFKDTARDRRKFVDRLDARIRSEEAEQCGLPELEGRSLHSTLRRGWYWGSQDFREKLLSRIGRKENSSSNRNYSSSTQGKDQSRREAEAILAKAVSHFNLEGADPVGSLKRGDHRKVAIAWAIWRRTSMPQTWIADRTGLKTAANVSQQVRRYSGLADRKLSAEERVWRSFFDSC